MEMLHSPTEAGGLGFCHDALSLLPQGYHGPLVISLDSNILIDLREHGVAVLNNGQIVDLEREYARNLEGLGTILNLWLVRDLRFVVTPRSLTDARRRTDRFLASHAPAVEAIGEALAFQIGDWGQRAPSNAPASPSIGQETGLPIGADRDLILEAQSVRAHIFLTRDKQVLKQARLSGPKLAIMTPAAVAELLVGSGVELFAGGTCTAHDCPYSGWPLPFPDIGKWGPLLSLF
ncbi:hypothetical protein QO003_000731 [Arthrobacter silviterrae]|nr:hypothetical protein [Arthrobacter silviterrae]